MANGDQCIEEEVRIELRAQGAQLRLGGESLHVVLAQIALKALLTHAQLVDAPRGQHRHRLEQRDVIGHQAPPIAERRDLDRIRGRVGCRNQHRRARRSVGSDERSRVCLSHGYRALAPANVPRRERRTEPPAGDIESIFRRGSGREGACHRTPQGAVVHPVQHDAFDEPVGRTAQGRIEQRRRDPHGEQHPGHADAQLVGIPFQQRRDEGCVGCDDDRDQREHRERALEKEVREREPIILVEDDEHQRE